MTQRVLVIDDDALVRELIADTLTGAGYAVLTASSGREGVARARTADLHLILLDYSMPELDGEATAKLLRADPHSRRIPIVALTSAPSSVANRLSRAGCIGFIPKPIDLSTFVQLIGQFLAATRRRPLRGG